jgi:S-adenosylmethionine-dependent methyltransferase
VSDRVRQFYDTHVDEEAGRLDLPLQQIEFRSTLRLVEKYFPATGKVCDIGSGPGRYSLELAHRGYEVSLVDLSAGLLSRARKSFENAGLTPRAIVQTNACELGAFDDGQFDAVLVLGPLDHLLDSTQRKRALSEALRVMVSGGVAILGYLNSWGLLRTGITDFPSWYRDRATARRLLQAGTYPAEKLTGFTDSYWSTPPDALGEVSASGFEIVTYAGVEGFCGGMSPLVSTLAESDHEAFTQVVDLAGETSELPQYRDATDHLHIVAAKR